MSDSSLGLVNLPFDDVVRVVLERNVHSVIYLVANEGLLQCQWWEFSCGEDNGLIERTEPLVHLV